MAAECARDALLQKVVDNKTDSGIDCLFRVCSFFFRFAFCGISFTIIRKKL